jgi:hypothetical protein
LPRGKTVIHAAIKTLLMVALGAFRLGNRAGYKFWNEK